MYIVDTSPGLAGGISCKDCDGRGEWPIWFDGIRQPNTLYVASVSRGKDSTAMLRAIQLMGWPLDAIVSVDIWFDDETPAELPPMVAFKDEWDAKCLEWFGLPVTHLCAEKRSQIGKVERERERERADPREPQDGECHSRLSYTSYFYRERVWSGGYGKQYNIADGTVAIYGFPVRCGAWCNSMLKVEPMSETNIRRGFLQTQPEKCSDEEERILRFPNATWKLVQHDSEMRPSISARTRRRK